MRFNVSCLRDWRAVYSPERDVFFEYVYPPDREAQIDFQMRSNTGGLAGVLTHGCDSLAANQSAADVSNPHKRQEPQKVRPHRKPILHGAPRPHAYSESSGQHATQKCVGLSPSIFRRARPICIRVGVIHKRMPCPRVANALGALA
jgi:hypothetical protein